MPVLDAHNLHVSLDSVRWGLAAFLVTKVIGLNSDPQVVHTVAYNCIIV